MPAAPVSGPAKLVALLLLVVVAASVAATTTPTASIAAAPSPVPFVDVSVESEPVLGTSRKFTFIVTNNLHPEFSAQIVRNVQVRLEPKLKPNERFLSGTGRFDAATGVWTIPHIAPGDSVETSVDALKFSTSGLVSFGDLTPLRVTATLVPGSPNEPRGFEQNNTTEQWYMIHRSKGALVAVGDAGVAVNVDNRAPQVEGQVVFGVRSVIRQQVVPGVRSSGSRSDNGTVDQVGVKLAIDVSEGLQFAPGLQPPGGTTFDNDTMIWDVGTVVSDPWTWPTLDVPVVVTQSPSLVELPLERRCLTAKVVETLPAYELDPRWRLNDVFTLCLGQRPAVISDGEMVLWWLHDCVDNMSDPCGAEDDIRLLAKVNGEYLDPKSVIVQIRDPGGRAYDGHGDSVTSGSVVSWQTADVGTGGFRQPNGVQLGFSLENFKSRASAWKTIGPFTVTKVQNLPGHLKIRWANNRNIMFDPNPSTTRYPIPSTSPVLNQTYQTFVEFETLGTHVITYKGEATRANGVTKYSDEGTYTFHVGPIAELQVRDSGQSPAVAPGQRAYTILAANNGPDAAPAVEVTLSGVPEGSQPALTDGAYREMACQDGLCDAIWDLGELPLTGGRIARGLTEFPTLTLIAPAGSGAPNISASNANTQDYSVVIDGTTHSTNYFDYYAANDTAVIVARRGTGDPSQPSVTTAQAYPQPPIAVLRWDPVERVNLWPVSHYELSRSDASCGLPDSNDTPERVDGTVFVDDLDSDAFNSNRLLCYYVRAVNELGVPGNWSAPVDVFGDIGIVRGVTVTPTDLTVAEDGGAATYMVVLTTQPPAPVTITPTTDDPKVATVETAHPNDVLLFGPGDWSIPQTVTVTGVNDAIDNPQNRRGTTIRHRAAGGGYGSVRVAPVSVTVTDDDDDATTPNQPPGVTVSQSQLLVAEDGGVATYTVSLNRQPSEDVVVTATVAPAGAATLHRSGAAPGNSAVLRFTTANWASPQTVTVTGQDDDLDNPNDQRTLRITHTARGGGYSGQAVGNPVAVTVVDDDVDDNVEPKVAFGVTVSKSALAMMEGARDSYSVTLNAEPLGPVRIELSNNDTDVATVAPTELVFTTGDWNMPQTVTVTGVDDQQSTGERTAAITHTISGGGYRGVVIPDLPVTVGDDDVKQVVVSAANLEVAEAGGKAAYTLALTSPPDGSGPVTVALDASGGAVDVSRSRVTFTTSNWDVPQRVTVTGVNDDIDNPDDRTAAITHTISGGGYGDVAVGDVAVTVLDDDTFGVTISETTLYVPTGRGEQTYTVRLNSRPTHDVTLNIEHGNRNLNISHGGRMTQGALDHDLVFTPNNWNNPKLVEVTNTGGASGTVTLRHRTFSADGNYDAKYWQDVEVQRVRKPKVTLSPTEERVIVTAGDPAELTLSIDGAALAYDLDVVLTVIDGYQVLLNQDHGTKQFTIPAGQTEATARFPTKVGTLSAPDYRCEGGRGSARVWVATRANYTSDNVLTAEPAIVEVHHPAKASCGR